MGYYLDMKVKGELKFADLGGKFFGYLEEEEYLKCHSAKFLACVCGQELYDLLNVWWSCPTFALNSYATEVFLNFYRGDLLKFKENPNLESLDKAIKFINESKEYDIYEFSLG